MQEIAQKGFLKEEILSMMQFKNQPREIFFKYNLLNEKDEFKKELATIKSCTIENNAFANIKRTVDIELEDDEDIDYLKDRIQPIVCFKFKNDILEYPQGIFLLNSPMLNLRNNIGNRSITCYDKLQILIDDKLDNRLNIAKGTNYIIAINNILAGAGIINFDINATDKVLSRDLEFEIGTPKLQVINKLLADINYFGLSVDEVGRFYSHPYTLPNDRKVDFQYLDDNYSVIYDDIIQELDLFGVPNVFIAVVSNSDQQPIKSEFINSNPNNILSTTNRGRRIVGDIIQVDNIADQATLDAYIRRIAYNTSNVYGKIEFSSAIMPFHSNLDTIRFKYFDKIDAVFEETGWSFEMAAGGKMQHKLRKVINL